jgi:ribonuclease HI
MTHIYTDGACLLNYRGGHCIGLCGFWDETKNKAIVDTYLTFGTTAYAMELKAIRMALEYIQSDCMIFCDSIQAIENFTLDINVRVRSSDELAVRNLFDTKNEKYNIQIQWVKSHSDNVGNNTIDAHLEQTMVREINKLPNKKRTEVISVIRERYETKGCFEKFSQGFFDQLLS